MSRNVKLSKPKLQGTKAKINPKFKQLKIDLQCLPDDLQEIPKGREQRLLIQALGLNCKTAKLLSALPPSNTCAREVYTLWSRLRRSKGVKQATKVLKELYLELIRYSSGLPTIPCTSTWLKRDRDGFPVALRSFKKPLREGSAVERRLTLGFVRTFESITCKPEVNLKTIISPSTGEGWYRDNLHSRFARFCKLSKFSKFTKKRFSDILEKTNIEGLIFNTKKGPYGGAACGSLTKQLDLMKERSLLPLLKQWANAFNRTDYDSIMEMMESNNGDIVECKSSHRSLGKLAFLQAPGCKTRVVAIVNYWLQDAMFPLHKILYGILKCLKADGTFDQDGQAERVRLATLETPVWSFDLTAATDRLPLCIQETVMASLSEEVGNLWSKTMRLLDFYCEETNSVVKYAVGQPMGAYSSWASLAISHHFIIQYCAWSLNRKGRFNDYAVLGDDVAIWDKEVAIEYQKLLAGLDVSISTLKSFVPEIKGNVVAEFAKRIFHNGVNITPVPTLFQNACWHDYTHWPTTLQWLSSNGWPLSNTALGEIIDLANLRNYQVDDFVCLLHIWNCINAPIFQEEVSERLPGGFEEFSIDDVFRERFELLSKKLIDIDLRDPVHNFIIHKKTLTDFYQGLARQTIGPISSEPSYFKLMRLTRMLAFEDLQSRFTSAIQSKEGQSLYGLSFGSMASLPTLGSSWNDTTTSFPAMGSMFEETRGIDALEDFDLKHKVQGLEYLPYPSYENMKNEVIANAEHWKLRDKYFRLISRRLSNKLT
jgi:hypothetical protein